MYVFFSFDATILVNKDLYITGNRNVMFCIWSGRHGVTLCTAETLRANDFLSVRSGQRFGWLPLRLIPPHLCRTWRPRRTENGRRRRHVGCNQSSRFIKARNIAATHARWVVSHGSATYELSAVGGLHQWSVS